MAAAWLFFSTPVRAEVEVKSTRIGHGVEAWYAVNDTVPVVSVVLSFEGAGTTSDPEGKGGRAMFASAMLHEGAGALDSEAFQRALEENAISIEVSAEDDRLRVQVRCLREHAVRAGELLAMLLGQPQLNETDAARVREQMRATLAQLGEQPDYQAGQLLATRGFAGHPYANAPYGSATSIAALSPQDVRNYLATYVTRGNLLVAAAGDVDARLLDDMLRPTVDVLAENDSGAVPITQATLQHGGELARQSMAVPQTVIRFAAPSIARDDPRFYAAYLLNHILGGHALNSRLSDQVRREKGLVYGIQTQLDNKRGVALLEGGFATRNNSAEGAITEVKAVMETLRTRGITTEECADAKSNVLGAFPLQLDTSSAVANALLMMQYQKLGKDYLEKREGYFTKVNCADINTLAEEMLQPNKFLFAIVGGSDAGAAK